MWKKIGKAFGKALGWLVKNPETIGAILEGLDAVKKKKKQKK